MKKFILIILLLFSFLDNYAQRYIPLPTKNATWTIENYIPRSNSFDVERLKIVNSDTFIYGRYYTELSSTSTLIRQDTVNKKVYGAYEDSFPPHDVLLYDFDLKAGDTLNNVFLGINSDTNAFGGFIYKKIVYSIDSILIGNSYRKRFNIWFAYPSLFPSTAWIEGIGDTTGFFSEGITGGGEAPQHRLICFKVDSNILYSSFSHVADCDSDYINNVNELKPMIHSTLLIYPNPTQNELTIGGLNDLMLRQINVIDALGREVINLKPVKSKTSLDINSLSPGIYFIKVQMSNENVEVGKFVKE